MSISLLFKVSLLAAGAAAEAALASTSAVPTPYILGMHSPMEARDLLKRQAGYQPTETACSYGATCAEACGAGSETCDDSLNPNPEFSMYCYNPTLGDKCCSDRSGHSCSAGYFCTKDNTGGTWCCPDGMSLADCQAAYTITGSLSSIPALTASASGSAATSSTPITSSYSSTGSTSKSTTTSSTSYSTPTTPATNGTVTTKTSPSPTTSHVVVAGAPAQGFSGGVVGAIMAAAAVFAWAL